MDYLQLKRIKSIKHFVVKISDENEIDKIFVYDTHPKIAKYWWSKFLQLNEEKTDVYNTDKAFNSIVKRVINPLKKISTVDHLNLFQSTVQYFQNKGSFQLDDFVNDVFLTYEPQNSEIQIEHLVNKINELPEKYDFDTQFNIDSSVFNRFRLQ